MGRADSTAKNRPALLAKQKELLLQFIGEHKLEGVTVDYDGMRWRWWGMVFASSNEVFVAASQAEFLQMMVQFFRSLLRLGLGDIEHNQFHIVVQKVARETDIDGCLNLITSQNPQLDTGICEQRYGIRYTILESILDSSSTDEHEVLLNGASHMLEFLITFGQRSGCNVMLPAPCLILFFVNYPICNAESSQSFTCEKLKLVSSCPSQLLLLPPSQA